MGFVKIEQPPFVTRSFKTGAPDFGVGTVWACDECGRHWELVSIPARGSKGKSTA